MARHFVGLYPPIVSDLRATVDALTATGYDAIVTAIVNPQYTRCFNHRTLQQRHTVFSRSDLVLEANEWHQRIIAKITDTIDCDSADPAFRRHSEKMLLQEMSLADHLSNRSVLIRLHSARSVNLARHVVRQVKRE